MGRATKIENWRRRVATCALQGVFGIHEANGAQLPRDGIRTVLICRRNIQTIGDTVLLTPLLAELARTYADAMVDIVCSDGPDADALLRTCPNVGYLHPARQRLARHLLTTASAFGAVRRRHYDLAIDPDPWSQTGRLLTLTANTEHSVGFVGPRKGGRLAHGIPVPASVRHRSSLPVYLLRTALGEDPAARVYPQPCVTLTSTECAVGVLALARAIATASGDPNVQRGVRIGVFANATAARRLARDWWYAFTAALQVQMTRCRILEIAPPSGTSLLGHHFPMFYSSDIRKVAAFIASLDAFVSADCGVMHLAWATGTPTIGLFQATDPAEWGPFGPCMGALTVRGATPDAIARRCAEHFRSTCTTLVSARRISAS